MPVIKPLPSKIYQQMILSCQCNWIMIFRYNFRYVQYQVFTGVYAYLKCNYINKKTIEISCILYTF